MENRFSPEELAHYQRQLTLPELGLAGQQKLKNARVLVVGAGGLGCPLLLYLAAAGIGHIGIVDGDTVDAGNLHRQVLYTHDDIGLPKATAARQRLLALNPHIDIQVFHTYLRRDNALDILRAYHLVADGTDNFATRYLVNDACVLLGLPSVYASVSQYEGQVSVFNLGDGAGNTGPNYRDLFPQPPAPGTVPSCAEAGVLGVLPGIIGCLQANEVIKIATGIGEPLSGKLFVLDTRGMESRTIRFSKRVDTPEIRELIDYDVFCGTEQPLRSITRAQLEQWRVENIPHQLIDVREAAEYAAGNMGGELMPLSEFPGWVDRISRNLPVVIHCQTGKRSARVVRELEKMGYDNVWQLQQDLMFNVQ